MGHKVLLSLLQGEVVSNHDELMSNFFAQADALALGKTPIELRSENVRSTFRQQPKNLSAWLPPVPLSACRWWPGSHSPSALSANESAPVSVLSIVHSSCV